MGSSCSHVIAVAGDLDENTTRFHVDLPAGSRVLTMRENSGEPTLYVLSIKEVAPTERRYFILVGDEEPIEIEGGRFIQYIATVNIRRCTRHLFEIK